MIRNKLYFYYFLFSLFFPLSLKADFGDADFPIGMFDDGPKSYHDAWCRSIKNKCRVRFQGPAMWVEGQGGIQINQLISYRYDVDNYVRELQNFANEATAYANCEIRNLN